MERSRSSIVWTGASTQIAFPQRPSRSAFPELLFSAPNHGAGRRYSGDITDQPQLVEHVLENLIQRATEVVGPRILVPSSHGGSSCPTSPCR